MSKTRALLVYINQHRDSACLELSEFISLVDSTDADYKFVCQFNLRSIHSKTYLTKGLLGYLYDCVAQVKPDIVIISQPLEAKHQRNLVSALCDTPIIDINELILDIFASRAKSHIGKVQVELAQVQHLSTRLVRGWTHLERQKGGIGLRGPGEKQLETDRRLLRKRITRLKAHLARIKSQLAQNRKQRQEKAIFQVALVGYTNAGKSSLFNRLTSADAYAADQLFATLDPKVNRMKTEYPTTICISDTVGFMSYLPDALLEAFRATLDQLHESQLIIHVIDGSDKMATEKEKAVTQTLEEMGIDMTKVICAYNKIDLSSNERDHYIQISAMSGEGIAQLKELILAQSENHTD